MLKTCSDCLAIKILRWKQTRPLCGEEERERGGHRRGRDAAAAVWAGKAQTLRGLVHRSTPVRHWVPAVVEDLVLWSTRQFWQLLT